MYSIIIIISSSSSSCCCIVTTIIIDTISIIRPTCGRSPRSSSGGWPRASASKTWS